LSSTLARGNPSKSSWKKERPDVTKKMLDGKREDARWKEGRWVKIFGTYGHTYGRGSREVALNLEPDENFDTVFSEFGTIQRKTKVDHFMNDEVDDKGNFKKVFRPKKASRSLKMIIDDDKPIPREFNYISPTSDRAKVIRVFTRANLGFAVSLATLSTTLASVQSRTRIKEKESFQPPKTTKMGKPLCSSPLQKRECVMLWTPTRRSKP
jgi:hypothetical protein